MLLILLCQFRGKRFKILRTLSDNQKSSGNNIIHLTMLITQGTIQGQPRQLTFIVIHDSNRIIERIACRNGATDSMQTILFKTGILHFHCEGYFFVIAIFRNSAYQNNIFAICSLRMLLVHQKRKLL